MRNEEKEFWVLAVKLLFRRIEDGKVTFARDRVPQTLRALEAVKFDYADNPIFETITGPVRALANVVYMHELERLEEEAEEREKNSPLHDMLGALTLIDADILRKCERNTDFTRLAFELYKETGVTLAVAAHCYITADPAEKGFERNQAICAGLLVRISKFMISVVQLIATGKRRRTWRRSARAKSLHRRIGRQSEFSCGTQRGTVFRSIC